MGKKFPPHKTPPKNGLKKQHMPLDQSDRDPAASHFGCLMESGDVGPHFSRSRIFSAFFEVVLIHREKSPIQYIDSPLFDHF